MESFLSVVAIFYTKHRGYGTHRFWVSSCWEKLQTQPLKGVETQWIKAERKRIWHVTEKETFLLPYFGSDPQSDLLKSSTVPEEVGHLVTLILVERPNPAKARVVGDSCFPEVVKNPLRSLVDPLYSGNAIKYNDWNPKNRSNKIIKALITCQETLYFALLGRGSMLRVQLAEPTCAEELVMISVKLRQIKELSKHLSYSPWLKKKVVWHR